MKKHIVRAMISVVDKLNIKYAVCYLEQVYYEDDSFKYIFRPNYNVIELLDHTTFQGIPGLNLDLKKESYIRENKIPTFIYERTPQKNREDLWELLDEVNLECLDHLEWLIRTQRTYTGDNFVVEVYSEPKLSYDVDSVNCRDEFIINELENISNDNFILMKFLIDIISKGALLKTGDFTIDDTNRKSMYSLVYLMYKNEFLKRKKRQEAGIKKAKEGKKYAGRKKIAVSLPMLEEVINKMERKKITAEEAMTELGLKSKSTLYRRIKEFKNQE